MIDRAKLIILTPKVIYFEYLATRTGEREKGRWKGNGKGKQEGKYFPNGELFYWKGAEKKI